MQYDETIYEIYESIDQSFVREAANEEDAFLAYTQGYMIVEYQIYKVWLDNNRELIVTVKNYNRQWD